MDSDDVFCCGCLCALVAPALLPLWLIVTVGTALHHYLTERKPE